MNEVGLVDTHALGIVKSYSIATIVVQLIFCLTLQGFQLTKVKAAIRAYLLFDLFSVLAVNASFLGVINEYDNSQETFSLTNTDRVSFDNLTVRDVQGERWGLGAAFLDLNQIFVSMRKCCMILIRPII